MSAAAQATLAELEQEPELAQDPWMTLHLEAQGSDSWLLSYVDVLTLLLVLMVVLLMLQHAGNPEAEVELPADQALVAKKRVAPPAKPESKATAVAVLKPEPELERPPVEGMNGVIDPLILAEDDTASELPLLTESLLLPEATPVSLPQPEIGEVVDQQANRPVQAQAQSTVEAQIEAGIETGPENEVDIAESMRPQDHRAKRPPGFDAAPLVDALRWRGLGNGVTLSTTDTQVRLETRNDILFADASVELTENGADLLMELAGLLARYPGVISVEGHADSRPITSGAFPSNWELSSARAASVVRYLVDQGIDSERLRAVGYGDKRPRADNDTAEGRASNRRVSLVLEVDPEGQSESAHHFSLM